MISTTMEEKPKEAKTPTTGFASINEDLFQNILKRIPALSFASAACVSKSWNRNCNQILYKPKLASAFSLNPVQKVALEEVVNKVLSEPIRPQFAIANVIGSGVHLSGMLDFLAAKLGSKTPIIVSCAGGIMGRDAVTDEYKEVMIEDFWVDGASNSSFGIMLSVGFLPGLKVDAIPLLRPRKARGVAMVDKFVMDIRNYAALVSDSTSPSLIIMFGSEKTDQKPVMEKLDHAMSRETIVVGDERAQFLYRSGIESRNVYYGSVDHYFSDAVALVFARDQNRPSGTGEIHFHSALSSGVSATGPRFKAVSANEIESETGLSTWLTVRREGGQQRREREREIREIMASNILVDKPHAVCIPHPAQSHINSMLKLAKLLHHKGFHITFVNTEFNHKRLLRSRGPDSLTGLPDFRFESIPDGFPAPDENAAHDFYAICEASRKNLLGPFNDLLDKVNDTASSDFPPVTYIVSDGAMPVAIDTAAMHEIPIALFYTISACSFMGTKQFRALKEKGLTPLEDESFLTNGYLDKVVDWIPGMRDIKLRDLPSFVRTTDPNDYMFNFCVECAERAAEGSAVIFHTFDALEQEVLNAFYSMFPRVYAIGPLQLLLNQMQEDDLNSIGSNLWKEEVQCVQWLDSQKSNSVVYVNFGSVAVATKQQLIEFGMGLAKSGHPFLWIIRPDMIAGDCAILPPEFTEETKDRCFISSWCPQEEVLDHPSVGGFLTHCGWTSIIESISSGVPMLCWPFAGDQQTNCRYTCTEWGIGMEIDSNVTRDKVEKIVREFMEGEKAKEMKKKAMEWKKLAEEATGPGGSSSMNLDKLVTEVLLS